MNNKRRAIFFTADWHVGHEGSITFDKRPFTGLHHMHKVFVNNYNSMIGDGDVCYFLGDMGLCTNETLKSVMDQLNGTKVLVLGNHDKGVNSMYNLGFDVVLTGAVMYIAGERVTLSHCPLKGVYREDRRGMIGSDGTENWHGEHRDTHSKLSFTNEGQFHLHGHIHSPNRGKSEKTLGRQYDVGVVNNKYRPVSINEIESFIVKTKREEEEDSKC
jgi:calcineurin-like phosphoesterase family protein